jgi:hypothetical protein
MTKLFGVTYRDADKILLESALVGVPKLSTLVHEMVHRMNWGLSESRTVHLEYAITSLVLSNPELFKELASHAPKKPRRAQ